MAKQITVEVELNGKKISHINQLTIEQDIFNHNTFHAIVPFQVLENDGENFFNQSHKNTIGKSVMFSVKDAFDESNQTTFKFVGIVTEIVLLNSSTLANYFALKGYSADIILKDGKQKRAFVEQSTRQIIDDILGPYPSNLLKKSIKVTNDTQHDYVVQYDESNFDFLRRLAFENSLWYYYDGSNLVIGDPKGENVNFDVNGIQTFEMSVSVSPSKFSLTRYDYLKDTSYNAESSGQSLSGLDTFSDFALKESDSMFAQPFRIVPETIFKDQNELNSSAKILKQQNTGNLVSFQGKGETFDITLGTVITARTVDISVNGETTNNVGKFRVVAITHLIDESGNYQNNFTAMPEPLKTIPSRYKVPSPTAGVELAKVIDNDDPEKLGRVKVKFFWDGDNNLESGWVRVATNYSGAGKGNIFIPEIDAEVLVSYEFNNPLSPLIVGSVYPKKGEEYTSSDNKLKVLQTKGGNTITFDDTSNDEKLTITNLNKDSTSIKLNFKEDGSIEISTEGPLSLKGKDVTIEGETIKMKAQKSIEIQAQQDLKVQSGTDMQIKSNNSLKVEAITADLSASAELKAKGAMANLEADGILTLKGAMVKIN